MDLLQFCNKECVECGLHSKATNVCIPGRGSSDNLRMVLIGEGPGLEEDSSGHCFVGPSGKLLGSILKEVGAEPTSCRFENVVRCVPKPERGIGTRSPTKDEIASCSHYLYDILTEIADNQDSLPLLVSLGNTATEFLTGRRGVTKIAGSTLPLLVPSDYLGTGLGRGYEVVPCIHPAAALRGLAKAESSIKSVLRMAWSKAVGETESQYWREYEWVDSIAKFEGWVNDALDKYKTGVIKWVAMDTETTTLNFWEENARIVCWSMCVEPGKAAVLPIYHKDSPWKDDTLLLSQVERILRNLISTVPVVGWNFPFDMSFGWSEYGTLFTPNVVFDGYFAHSWWWGERRPNHSLDGVVASELEFWGHGVGVDKSKMYECDRDLLIRYAGGDADGTLQECNILRDILEKEGQLATFLKMQMTGLIPAADMEWNGIQTDPAVNEYLKVRYPEIIERLHGEIEETPPGSRTAENLRNRVVNEKLKPISFSLGSPTVTLQDLFFKQLNLTPTAVSEVGNGSTDAESIKESYIPELRQRGDSLGVSILEKFLVWREKKDEFNRYVVKLEKHMDSRSVVHPSINIAGTVTGRASSWFHGIKKSTTVKSQFISRWKEKGGLILSPDFSQAEVRVLASLSGDPGLIDVIKSGLDIHTANAARMLHGIDISKPGEVDKAKGLVTPQERDVAKRLGFGVIYGISSRGLASRLGCSEQEAQRYINQWKKAYPRIDKWIARVYKRAKENGGRVVTPFGRVRWVPDSEQSTWGDRTWIQIYNTIIQSTSSDLASEAWKRIRTALIERNMKSLVIMFKHDEITLDVYPSELFDVYDIAYEEMVTNTNSLPFISAPMSADFKIGANMGMMSDLTQLDDGRLVLSGSKVINNRVLMQIGLCGFGYEELSENSCVVTRA